MTSQFFDVILDTLESDSSFNFKDGKFKFYKIQINKTPSDDDVIFRVRENACPHDTALEKGVSIVKEIVPAKHTEILLWMEKHSVEIHEDTLYITQVTQDQ